MREIRKLVWASVVAAAAATPVAAQQGTATTAGGRTTTTLTGTGGLTGGGAGQVGTGGINSGGGIGGSGGTGGGGNLGGTELQGTQLQTMTTPPQLSAPTGTATSSLQRSNFLAGYYANPYFQGQITSQTNAVPGGFGNPLYGTTGTTGRGAVAGTTGLGGIGGRTGGLGGQNSANQSGILIPVQVQMAYTARMQFPTPPVAGTKIVADIRSVIDNTPMIANAKGVQIITDANNNVTIRGNAADADEAALIEGLVRITPGVAGIKNELAVPATVANR